MKLTLNRKFKGQTYTIGDLSIDGKFFFCEGTSGNLSGYSSRPFLYLQGKGLFQDRHSCRDL